ncbi:hypothetical protein [Alicyclobacillus fodiniaquatilis]|uniref:Uncharacterized protein n=1 Tax=Alicyclobacillus fodiniaquatilis TaxID=1661150 RepID=A0ABW4JMX8_9BACL
MREDYADNLEEYRNPSLYDLENSLEETELAFLRILPYTKASPLIVTVCQKIT